MGAKHGRYAVAKMSWKHAQVFSFLINAAKKESNDRSRI